MKEVYVDNNATTRVAPEVMEAMLPFLTECYANPSSIHKFGGVVAQAVEHAREHVAQFLGAHPDEIIFTSCATESNNAAILGVLCSFPHKKHIVTTSVEHPCVYGLCQSLETRGYRVTYLSVDRNGMIDLDELRDSITDETALVSTMYANNETGVIFPVERVGTIARERGVLFHCDAVQAVGKVPLDMNTSSVDLLSISGHKLHAPKGVGALYLRRGTPFVPFLVGGHQEGGRRAGTENVPGIVGLGRASLLAQESMDEDSQRVAALRQRLEEGIDANIPRVFINGRAVERLPNTSDVSFEAVEGEAILLLLSEEGIAASSGSACTSGESEPSHVLRAMDVPATAIQGTVRFSLCRYNTADDIEYILERLPAIIGRLRTMSPFWSEEGLATG
jgi:cysteine desulfurase